MPFMSKTEVMTLKLDGGWVTEASVEDVKLLPGVHRVIFRLEGGTWVAREIVREVRAGRARFVVNSGDVVWWGTQGHSTTDSPYWKRVNDTMLNQLPAPDDEMRAAGLDGRWFIGAGNHEVWGNPKIEGIVCRANLKKLGVTPERLIYKFDFKGVRFIFLWSGNMITGRPRCGMVTGQNMQSRCNRCDSGWMMPRPTALARPSSSSIIRCSPERAWVRSRNPTILTR